MKMRKHRQKRFFLGSIFLLLYSSLPFLLYHWLDHLVTLKYQPENATALFWVESLPIVALVCVVVATLLLIFKKRLLKD